MAGRLSVLVPARDEEARIGGLVERLRGQFPDAEIIVSDDGSRDRTARLARAAGAVVVRGPRLGKGEALNAAERAAPRGPLLLCDADLEGDLRALPASGYDLAIAAFATRIGGGLGLAKRTARELIRLRTGRTFREPLSGQRYLSERARAACFPVARGFGCEVRMTIDACRAGLSIGEVELPLSHRATTRSPAGFVHRGRQLAEALLACGPLAVNHRGNRLPLLGTAVALGGARSPAGVRQAVAAIAVVGLLDDLFSGPERGWRAHLRAGATTGVLKLVAIPSIGLAATGSASGALLVGLAANFFNQLDTGPGRALKAFLLASAAQRRLDAFTVLAVLLLPYDLRERMMLGDAGSNALGAVVALRSVARQTSCGRWMAVGTLAGLNLLGERVSLGRLIERTAVLRALDELGRARP